MNFKTITSDQIAERTLQHVAALPCQKAYVKQLATILSMHIHKNNLMDQGFLPDDLPSVSAIVVAPTGQGKTFLLRKMAECLELNLIIVDCSTLAAEGWKGVGLAQRLLTAQKEASDEKAFERSILFLDEIDKLHFWGSNQDQGNPVYNILQMYNAGYVTAEGPDKEAENIDIRRFTIFLGGAFDGLDAIVENRLYPKSRIGFGSENNNHSKANADLIQQVTHEDLIAYGMLPELLGRIGTILTIPPLSTEDYQQLLCAGSCSIQTQYSNYLKSLYGVGFSMTESAITAIADKCMASSSGTRAAVPIVNDLIRDAVSAVERDQTVKKVIIDHDGNDLVVKYEYGERSYCYLGSNQEDLSEHIIRAKSTSALANKLCRYYKKAGGDIRLLPELHAFLECTLAYLDQCTPPNDFRFRSLEILARTVSIEKHGSKLEKILCGHDMTLYRKFRDLCTCYTQRNLITALQLIMEFIESHHKRVNVRFTLKAKRT